jgi:polysaccharide pyruvyl transferase WcaK-like protein
MTKVLYLGWVGFRNLGDELSWRLFQRFSKKYGQYEKIAFSLPLVCAEQIAPYDVVVLGGGSLIKPEYMQILQQATQMEKKVLVWGSGIDGIDKQDVDLLLANELPDLTKYFSLQDSFVLKHAMAAAAFAGIRGPLSQKLLEALAADHDHIYTVSDPALLLKTKRPRQKRNAEKIIGINWGTTYNRLFGQNEEMVENALAKVAKKLMRQGYHIYIYAVWDNDRAACKRLYDKISCPYRVVWDQKLYSEKQLIRLLSRFSATINLKLHANLLSLAASVPPVLLGYRFKVFDCAASLGLERYVVSTDAVELEEELLQKLELVNRNRQHIVHQYSDYRSFYRPLLMEPFQKELFF